MDLFQLIAENDLSAMRVVCSRARQNGTLRTQLAKVDEFGNTPLLKACYKGRYDAACLLLRNGACVRVVNYFGQNALTLATYAGNELLVHELLGYRTYKDFNDSSIIPALCVASMQCNGRLINYFMDLDPHSGRQLQTSHGLTPTDLYSIFTTQRRAY